MYKISLEGALVRISLEMTHLKVRKKLSEQPIHQKMLKQFKYYIERFMVIINKYLG